MKYADIMHGDIKNSIQLLITPNLRGGIMIGKGNKAQHKYHLALLCHSSFARQQTAMTILANQIYTKKLIPYDYFQINYIDYSHDLARSKFIWLHPYCYKSSTIAMASSLY